MYNLERIRKEVKDICNSQNVKCGVPITYNNRLSRCLGRVLYVKKPSGGIIPTEIQFSKRMIDSMTDETIRQVILHECAHYIVARKYPNEKHGHDNVFRTMCEQIGCTHNRACNDVEYTEEYTEKKRIEEVKENNILYKYELKCECCGKTVGKFKRAGKRVQYPELYHSTCCNAKVIVKQNY